MAPCVAGRHPAATNAMLAAAGSALLVCVVTLIRPMSLSSMSLSPISMPAPAPAASPVASPIDTTLPGEPAVHPLQGTAARIDGSPHGHIGRQGSDIIINLKAMPRTDAVLQLAALTNAQVLEGRNLLAHAAPVTLHWRGADAVGAWRQLLGENIRHAVHCDAEGCRVWILALNGPEGAMFTNGIADDNVVALQETPVSAGAADPIEPETEARVGPMNTPTPPDEHSESSEPDSTTPDAALPAETGYTLAD